MGYNNSRDEYVEEKKEDSSGNNSNNGNRQPHQEEGEGAIKKQQQNANSPDNNNVGAGHVKKDGLGEDDEEEDLVVKMTSSKDEDEIEESHDQHHNSLEQPLFNFGDPSNQQQQQQQLQAGVLAQQLLQQALAQQQQQQQQQVASSESLNSILYGPSNHSTNASTNTHNAAVAQIQQHVLAQHQAAAQVAAMHHHQQLSQHNALAQLNSLIGSQQQQQLGGGAAHSGMPSTDNATAAATVGMSNMMFQQQQHLHNPVGALSNNPSPFAGINTNAIMCATNGGAPPNAIISPCNLVTVAGGLFNTSGNLGNLAVATSTQQQLGHHSPTAASPTSGASSSLTPAQTIAPTIVAAPTIHSNISHPSISSMHHAHRHQLQPQLTIPHYIPPIPPTWGAQIPALTVQDRPLVPPIYNGINPNYPGAQLLHANPPIFAVENFLTPAECDFLIAAASDAFGPAPVVGAGAGEVSPSRTSSTCYLAREDLPEYLRKVSLLTGKPAEHCELPQVGRYYPSQQYLQHFDAFDLSNEDGRRFAANGGQRTVTVLVYLNDVPRGGATSFPNLNIEVQPRRGMAVVFFPSTLDGLLDKMALHAALPAVDVKYVSQVWIRQSNYEGRASKRLAEPMVAGLQERREQQEELKKRMVQAQHHQQQLLMGQLQMQQQHAHHHHQQQHHHQQLQEQHQQLEFQTQHQHQQQNQQ